MFLNIILLIVAYLSFLVAKPILNAFLISLILTILVKPIHRILQTKCKIHKVVATLLTMFLTFSFILTPIFLIATLLFTDLVEFITFAKTSNFLDLNFTVFGTVIDFNHLTALVQEHLNAGLTIIASNLKTLLLIASNSLTQLLVFTLFFFYLLNDSDKLVKTAFKVFKPYKNYLTKIFDIFNKIVNLVFKSSVTLSLYSAVIAYVVFSLLDFQAVPLITLLAFVFAFVPTIGTLLLYAGATLLLFTQGFYSQAVILLIAYILLELLLKDNYLYPKFFEDKLSLHPILVLFSLTGGLTAFGPIGIFYGPLILTVALTVFNFYLANPSAKTD